MQRLSVALWSVLQSADRRATRFILCAGVLLTSTALFNGIALDDRFQRATVRGFSGIHRAAWDQFRFLSGDPLENGPLIDRGLLPWLSLPDVKTAFFRPLSSLSLYADYALLPQWPWLFHLESLALYALLIALVFRLYRQLLPGLPLAALAALMFAVDDAHGLPVGWLANRNALFAAVFGVCALLCHHRAVTSGRILLRALAAGYLALALLSGEMGVAAFAYLVAYGLLLHPGSLPRRLLGLAPYLVVFAGYLVALRALHYGVNGSAFYVDPLRTPLPFLKTFPGYFLALAVSQFALPAADLWIIQTAVPWPVTALCVLLGVALLVAIGRTMWPLVRARREYGFLGLGALLSLCLSTLTIPADRNLLFAGIGAFPLIAECIGSLVTTQSPAPRWLRRTFIGVHLVFAPLFLPLETFAPGALDLAARAQFGPALASADIREQTLVLINPTALILVAFYGATPDTAGGPVPARIRVLSPTTDPFLATREDERTLRVRLEDGYFTEPTAAVVRAKDVPFHAGDEIALPGFEVRVEKVDARGRPLELAFTFEVPLESRSLRWVRYDGRTLAPFTPPAIGETVRVTSEPAG